MLEQSYFYSIRLDFTRLIILEFRHHLKLCPAQKMYDPFKNEQTKVTSFLREIFEKTCILHLIKILLITQTLKNVFLLVNFEL